MEREEERRLESLSPFEIKNILIELAETHHERMMLNAGRGNPNWVATRPRHSFFQLGLFAMTEAERSFTDLDGFGGHPEKQGIDERFAAFVNKQRGTQGVQFLKDAVAYVNDKLGVAPVDFIFEMVDGILADNYPVPDRILCHSETIINAYLKQELCAGDLVPEGKFDLFATEGGTAAMTYIFNSLSENKLIKPGDKIGLGTPIFTPYLEIPILNDYRLVEVDIMASEEDSWQVPDTEIDKLLDPEIKAFFLVNPSNPPSVRLRDATIHRIADIVNTKRKDLILLTDDVYCTFTNNFTSLAAVAPANTIGVYSFSKYFGATGWRLGVIALHEDNILDKAIRALSKEDQNALKERYEGVSLDPAKMKLIDRMVADSRAVALNHTAGLSTPQQVQMVLFSLYGLLDHEYHTDAYKKEAQGIVKRRYNILCAAAKVQPIVSADDPNNACYYTEVDILRIAEQRFGKEFADWLVENFEPLDFEIRLAEEKSVVLMPGGGFAAPEWSLRVSLANLPDEAYSEITISIRELLEEYYQRFQQPK